MEEIRYEILQLKEEYKDRRFMGLQELSQTGLSVSAEQYHRAYSGACSPDVPLDDIYAMFNHDQPDDFHGWSLSLGDVILLHQADGDHAYFVDIIGFQELKDFLPPQNRDQRETMLVTVRNASRDEQNFAYTQNGAILVASGSIGHLRFDMGPDGEEFYTDWTDHAINEVPEGFGDYLNALISGLRTNPAFDGMLADHTSLSSFCYRHRGGEIPDEDNHYAFRVDGGEYSMVLRLTPNRGEYNYVYCYQREALDRALIEVRNARAQAYAPVYRHTAAYAREAGELEVWCASHRENVACRTAIDEAISKHFNGAHLDKQAVRSVLDAYGAERMAYVLANTVVMKERDGRFSRDNRAWAQAENIPIDRTDFGHVRNDEYVSQSHSTILNGYIGMARREMEAPGIEKSAVIAVPAAPDKTVRRSVRSQLHEKQAQARPASQEQQQPARKPRRESR